MQKYEKLEKIGEGEALKLQILFQTYFKDIIVIIIIFYYLNTRVSISVNLTFDFTFTYNTISIQSSLKTIYKLENIFRLRVH